jgi:hypothetical protein
MAEQPQKDQSHRDEMNSAIRAQRARQAVPRTIAPEEPTAAGARPEPETPRSLLRRLRGK